MKMCAASQVGGCRAIQQELTPLWVIKGTKIASTSQVNGHWEKCRNRGLGGRVRLGCDLACEETKVVPLLGVCFSLAYRVKLIQIS